MGVRAVAAKRRAKAARRQGKAAKHRFSKSIGLFSRGGIRR